MNYLQSNDSYFQVVFVDVVFVDETWGGVKTSLITS